MSREQLVVVVPLAEMDAQDFLSAVEHMVDQVSRTGGDADWGTVEVRTLTPTELADDATAAIQGWTGPALQLTVQANR